MKSVPRLARARRARRAAAPAPPAQAPAGPDRPAERVPLLFRLLLRAAARGARLSSSAWICAREGPAAAPPPPHAVAGPPPPNTRVRPRALRLAPARRRALLSSR